MLYPPLCVVCGDALVRGERYFCSSCLFEFPLAYGEMEGSDLGAEKLHALFFYDKYGQYKKLVHVAKYRHGRELCEYLGELLGGRIWRIGDDEDFDAIVPIPLHPKREKHRGYNQSREIARGIAEEMGIPMADGIVKRVVNNVTQTGKNAAERQKNVENIFQLTGEGDFEGKHLLIVDDVVTTGATIQSCMRTLAEGFPGVRFSIACLARTKN